MKFMQGAGSADFAAVGGIAPVAHVGAGRLAAKLTSPVTQALDELVALTTAVATGLGHLVNIS